jgi:threonine/homoserine/homoserine lactone efflux protein
MTKSESDSKLELLKKRSKPLLTGGIAIACLNSIAAILWLIYQRQMTPHHFVIWGLVLFIVYVITCFGWFLAGKAMIRRYAPRCPRCGLLITWTTRNLIASTGSCPKCQTALFE